MDLETILGAVIIFIFLIGAILMIWSLWGGLK